jgi:hypothetical protein
VIIAGDPSFFPLVSFSLATTNWLINVMVFPRFLSFYLSFSFFHFLW